MDRESEGTGKWTGRDREGTGYGKEGRERGMKEGEETGIGTETGTGDSGTHGDTWG